MRTFASLGLAVMVATRGPVPAKVSHTLRALQMRCGACSYLVVSFVLRPAWLLGLALLVVWSMGATLLSNLDVLRADGQERRHLIFEPVSSRTGAFDPDA